MKRSFYFMISLFLTTLILLIITYLGPFEGFFLPQHVNAAGNIYYVAKNGSDSNPGTESQPWLTIRKAADTMVAGDTVYVKTGTYYEAIQPVRSGAPGQWIKYKEYPGNKVVIDGWNLTAPYTKGIFNITVGYIELDGFEIRYANNATLWAGVYAYGSSASNLSLKNLIIHNTYASGIIIVGSWSSANKISNVTIDGCETYDTNTHLYEQEGISLVSVDQFEIKNCRVHDTLQEGIDVKVGCSNGTIRNNKVYKTKVGIYVDAQGIATNNISIYCNEIHDSSNTGLMINSEGSTHAAVTGVSIFNNLIYNNKVGFNVPPATFNKTFSLINNTFHNNTHGQIGIGDAAEYQQNCVVQNNIIVGNHGPAYALLSYRGYPTGVTIDHNLFYDASGYNSANKYGSSHILANPLLTDPTGYSFRLTSNSPAIDSGSAIAAPSSDYVGTARPQGAGYDIGTYEYVKANPPDFTLSALPNTQTVGKGSTGNYTIAVTPRNGFTGSIDLGVSGLPGISAISFTPNPTTNSSILSIKTAKSTLSGTYNVAISGVSGEHVRTAQIVLVVPELNM